MKKSVIMTAPFLMRFLCVLLSGCSSGYINKEELPEISSEDVDTGISMKQELEAYFKNIKLADTYKKIENNNPLMTQRFGADPYAIVYDDTVYIYMTGDVLEFNSQNDVTNNTYGKVKSISVISSKDLVNWTDHGTIYTAGAASSAPWAQLSWAPAVAYRKVNGEDKFFLYFANGGNGICVLEADSPIGPFKDPLGHELITRRTPKCSDVVWLFDPAVFIDEDGQSYLYFGGGIPGEELASPGTIRVVKLNDDMISLDGEPVAIDVPYVFEDSGINKIGDTYYYSYCSNWNVPEGANDKLGIASAQICYMTSDNPMGPFTLQGAILKNPGDYFSVWGTNHHCIFNFHDRWYITYHSQILENEMGYKEKGYRCTHIDALLVNEDGTIAMATGSKAGVGAAGNIDPYQVTEAETIATMAGISTTQYGKTSMTYGAGNMVLTEIDTGDWLAVKNVDFGDDGATLFKALVCADKEYNGAIEIRIDGTAGEVIGYLEVTADEREDYHEEIAQLNKTVTGIHDLIFIFYGKGYTWDCWQFIAGAAEKKNRQPA